MIGQIFSGVLGRTVNIRTNIDDVHQRVHQPAQQNGKVISEVFVGKNFLCYFAVWLLVCLLILFCFSVFCTLFFVFGFFDFSFLFGFSSGFFFVFLFVFFLFCFFWNETQKKKKKKKKRNQPKTTNNARDPTNPSKKKKTNKKNKESVAQKKKQKKNKTTKQQKKEENKKTKNGKNKKCLRLKVGHMVNQKRLIILSQRPHINGQPNQHPQHVTQTRQNFSRKIFPAGRFWIEEFFQPLTHKWDATLVERLLDERTIRIIGSNGVEPKPDVGKQNRIALVATEPALEKVRRGAFFFLFFFFFFFCI